ncbi:FHA domain-containing protein [Rhodopseudomonas palustris]|nr:FHA domain-containing protein [Rhodopseudomonas palustris]
MDTGRGLSIAALVISIISIFVPLYGLYLIAIATLLAVASAVCGERPLTIAATTINLLDALFLSPSLYLFINIQDQERNGNGGILWLTIAALLCLPFLAMLLQARGYFQRLGGHANSPASTQRKATVGGAFLISTILPDGKIIRAQVSEDNRQCIVGRSAKNADMIIDDDAISRAHARFELRNGELWLSDLGSLNKTKVDGVSLEAAPVRVGPGSRVTLGPSVTLTISSS